MYSFEVSVSGVLQRQRTTQTYYYEPHNNRLTAYISSLYQGFTQTATMRISIFIFLLRPQHRGVTLSLSLCAVSPTCQHLPTLLLYLRSFSIPLPNPQSSHLIRGLLLPAIQRASVPSLSWLSSIRWLKCSN